MPLDLFGEVDHVEIPQSMKVEFTDCASGKVRDAAFFITISLFAENFPDKTQGRGCDLFRMALDSINARFLMNKEAYDESNIDPVDRCAGRDHRGLFKH